MASNPTFNFSDSMKEIDQINEWFQQDDLDLEEALTKLKRGKELIKTVQDPPQGC
ncbi:exodeoxyribonuclease VII small subunit [Candidatus Woesebacteria bacterium]|nr:exodeoxyribonuclease VII small subunit [Candidatus Woesebacteria bacterium]